MKMCVCVCVCEVNNETDKQFNSLLMINDSYTVVAYCPMPVKLQSKMYEVPLCFPEAHLPNYPVPASNSLIHLPNTFYTDLHNAGA